MQKPSIGRIVIFKRGDNELDAREHPAIITSVWSDMCVNLQVFYDAEPVGVVTSVLHVSQAGGGCSWQWPMREG